MSTYIIRCTYYYLLLLLEFIYCSGFCCFTVLIAIGQSRSTTQN